MGTDEDRYLFDLQGFLVLEGLLSADEVAAMNRIIDERACPRDDKPMTGFTPLLEWGEPFQRLIDHPKVLPYLEEWVDPGLRLDSAYGIHTVRETPQLDLHLGGTPYLLPAYYHFRNQRPTIGLTVVSWALTDVPSGRNGFVCIPGSHKANFPCPEHYQRLEVDLADNPAIRQLPVRAGDAIVFTEALTHGSFPWSLDEPRRVLFYRYTPGHMVFDPPAWSDDLIAGLTPRQRSILRPAYSRELNDEGELKGRRPILRGD